MLKKDGKGQRARKKQEKKPEKEKVKQEKKAINWDSDDPDTNTEDIKKVVVKAKKAGKEEPSKKKNKDEA